MAARNPGGREELTGDPEADRARDEGLLFWLGWVSHNSNSLFSTADASGPFRRIVLLATCTTYQQLLLEHGSSAPLVEDALGIRELLADSDLCPASGSRRPRHSSSSRPWPASCSRSSPS